MVSRALAIVQVVIGHVLEFALGSRTNLALFDAGFGSFRSFPALFVS
jgi:hypothetical protein